MTIELELPPALEEAVRRRAKKAVARLVVGSWAFFNVPLQKTPERPARRTSL